MEYAGCFEAVRRPDDGLTCVLPENGTLRLWVTEVAGTPLVLTADGREVGRFDNGEGVQGGRLLTFEAEPGVEVIEIRAGAASGEVLWQLELGDSLMVSYVQESLRADQALRRREFATAREILDGLEVPPDAPRETFDAVAYYRSWLAREVGDYRTALAEIHRAEEQAERLGLETAAEQNRQLLALALVDMGRFREAAEILDELLRNDAPDRPRGERAKLLNNIAWSRLLAREAGHPVGDPIPPLREAGELLDGLRGHDELLLHLHLNLVLARLQRDEIDAAEEALAAVRRRGEYASPRHRLWWLDLEARLALDAGRAGEALERSTRLGEIAARVDSPEGRWRAAVGRARAHDALGNVAAARKALDEAESLLDSQSLQVPLHEGRELFLAQRESSLRFHLELLLGEGFVERALAVARRSRARILRQLWRGDRLARLAPDQRRVWDAALARYRAAREVLDAEAAELWRLPEDQQPRVDVAREARGEEAQRELEKALVLLGEIETGALPPPEPGELILVYHPLDEGWAGFAATSSGVTWHRVSLPPEPSGHDGAELARLLLEPFRREIESSRSLRVLPYGRLREVDFHALPWNDEMLLADLPVVYSLDLGTPDHGRRSARRRARIVVDPRGDLLAAREEGDAVARTLRDAGWEVELLAGGDATTPALVRNLGTLDLLHYAGHGVFSGAGGLESALLLADESRLSVGDVLALDAPRWVVLSGCDTARSDLEAPLEGLGLAQAFLLAGAERAIAATRPVEDRETAELFTELYRRWDGETELAELLRQAQLGWEEDITGTDSVFRVLVP